MFIFSFYFRIRSHFGMEKELQRIYSPRNTTRNYRRTKKWLPVDSLHTIALNTINNEVPNTSFKVDRIDMRKEKGSVKFLFVDSFYEVQLDGANGNVLSIGKRRSDFFENIHDGSIVDDYLGTNGYIKLVYTNVMGISLLIFTITGFWLWYGPKRMRKAGKA